jgi:acetyl-CoA C-acetyltransferase
MGRAGIVITAGLRTAIGDFGGSLKDQPPSALGALVIREALARAAVEPGEIGHVVMGQVIHTEPRDMYLARVAAIEAGIPAAVPALTVNRLCGSGAQAIVSAAQMLALGECAIAVAGGAESMSRAPYAMPAMRFGARLGDAAAVDMLVGALHDPFGHGHMGITAENIAARYGIDRAAQDAFALESHRRAARALAEGRFAAQLVPVEVRTRKGLVQVTRDEHVRAELSAEDLAGLRPVFKQDGTVTPGNASGINDGAAALVLMTEAEAARRDARPLARLAGWGHAGVAPELMGLGPIPAVPKALAQAGITVADLDVIESNEAFAVQACAVSRELGLPDDKVNPNGGAVALGHPVGATGAILTVKAIHELERAGGRWALVTMCIGGGQGIALVLERLTRN